MTPDLVVLSLAPDGTWTTRAATQPTRGAQPAWNEASWHVFADPRAELHPRLAALLHRHGAERPDIDIVYGDEVIDAAPGRPLQHLCKPDFDAVQLMAQDYIGLPIAVRGRAMAALGSLDAAAPAGVYGMVLRAVAAGLAVGRITEVLAVNHPDAVRATAAERSKVLEQSLAQGAVDCDVAPGLVPSSVELRRRFADPPHVTVLVRTQGRSTPGQAPMVRGLLESLCQTDWPMGRLRVVVGNQAAEGVGQSWPFDVRLDADSSRAAGINQLWRASETEHVIFLDDGLLVRGPGWLRALMTFVVDEGVGGAGARLLNPDGTIRHAGMPCGTPGPYAFAGLPADAPTYQDWASVQREWSIVSGEAFATRRSLLEQVNGFDERFGFDVGQADLCLRLRMLGSRIVYTPHAELTQRNGASRDSVTPEPDETALFLEKWQHFIADDPAYHPRLSRNAPEITPVPSASDWWRQRPSNRLNRLRGVEGGDGGGGGSGGVQPE